MLLLSKNKREQGYINKNMSEENINTIQFDIEVTFNFTGLRKEYIYEGYRPLHLLAPGVLASGYHHYYNLNRTIGKLEGSIALIAPDLYPETLWVGKELEMYDDNTIIGYAVITKILNPILESSHTNFTFNSIF